MQFTASELELLEMIAADIPHIAAESGPLSDDHHLRRISAQLRNLLIDDRLIQGWRLLRLDPKQPIIVAPRLRTEGLDDNAVSVAAGGNLGHVRFANVTIRPGIALTAEEVKHEYEQGKQDMEFEFKLADYKESCAVFVAGRRISRRQLIAYVANKRGGAHLDHTRKKDEEAYRALDSAENQIRIGVSRGPGEATVEGGKTVTYAELLSIAQHLSGSPDVQRLVAECNKAFGR